MNRRRFLSKVSSVAGLWIAKLTQSPAETRVGGQRVIDSRPKRGLSIRVISSADAVDNIAQHFAGHIARVCGRPATVGGAAQDQGFALNIAAVQGEYLENNERGEKRVPFRFHRSNDQIVITGNTIKDLELACYYYLHSIGYRQFLPGSLWEFYPHWEVKDLLNHLPAVESTVAFFGRHIWHAYGTPIDRRTEFLDWRRKNLLDQEGYVQTDHSYGWIIETLGSEFSDTPEYWPEIDGVRARGIRNKFCIGNVRLQERICDVISEHVASHPTLRSVSMEPSDWPGWCECRKCRAIGNLSDQVFYLAGKVADRLEASFPVRLVLVGMYAYSTHSSPPKIPIHKNIRVLVATEVINPPRDPFDLIAQWSSLEIPLGVREYYGVGIWELESPWRSRAGGLSLIGQRLNRLRQLGVQFVSAESSYNWGANGLMYFAAAWHMFLGSSKITGIDPSRLVLEFTISLFPSTHVAMTRFFEMLWVQNPPKITRQSHIAQMRGLLINAIGSADQEEELNRIYAFAQYIQFVSIAERFFDSSSRQARSRVGLELIQHGYRMRSARLLHEDALHRSIIRLDVNVDWLSERLPAPGAVEQVAATFPLFTRMEIDSFLRTQ